MSIQLSFAKLYYEAPTVYIEFAAGVELGFVEIRQLISAAEELSGRVPYVVLSDVRSEVNITPMGRKIASDATEAPFHKGSAVLAPNRLIQLAADFFNQLSPTPYPYKAFTNREEAIAWLKNITLKTATS